jgi:hypothetical protein
MLSPELTDQIIGLPATDRVALMELISRSLKAQSLPNESANLAVIEDYASIEDYFVSGQTYEVWTPIEAPEAGQALLALLAAESTLSHE